MSFGDRAPHLAPRGVPIARLPAPAGRPIGLKGVDLPRPWTLRRVFSMLFLPRR